MGGQRGRQVVTAALGPPAPLALLLLSGEGPLRPDSAARTWEVQGGPSASNPQLPGTETPAAQTRPSWHEQAKPAPNGGDYRAFRASGSREAWIRARRAPPSLRGINILITKRALKARQQAGFSPGKSVQGGSKSPICGGNGRALRGAAPRRRPPARGGGPSGTSACSSESLHVACLHELQTAPDALNNSPAD